MTDDKKTIIENAADKLAEAGYVSEAVRTLGIGYDEPAIEIEAPRTVIQRRGGRLEEVEKAAFVKISTAFKSELATLDGNSLKVWLYIALSVNRTTGKAHPGVRTIAEGTSIAPNTVTAAVKRLEEFGLLSVDRETRKYNLYEPTNYVSANKADPKGEETVAIIDTDQVGETVAKSDTDAQTVATQPQTVATESESVADRLRLNQRNQRNHNISDETKKAILANPAWAIAAGVEYVPDPEQIALQTIRTSWDALMRTNTPWDRWENFDKWLLAQERAGMPAETFCKWFASDKFRSDSVGMWTPNGNTKDARFSFKAVYPQAFPVSGLSAATVNTVPEWVKGIQL
jgi:hypothetical protein